MISRHDRRHSGRKYTKVYHPEIYPYEEEKYDDWNDYRDGQRSPIDRSRIRPARGINWWFLEHTHIFWDNIKLKRKEIIRRIRKFKEKCRNAKRNSYE